MESGDIMIWKTKRGCPRVEILKTLNTLVMVRRLTSKDPDAVEYAKLEDLVPDNDQWW